MFFKNSFWTLFAYSLYRYLLVLLHKNWFERQTWAITLPSAWIILNQLSLPCEIIQKYSKIKLKCLFLMGCDWISSFVLIIYEFIRKVPINKLGECCGFKYTHSNTCEWREYICFICRFFSVCCFSFRLSLTTNVVAVVSLLL